MSIATASIAISMRLLLSEDIIYPFILFFFCSSVGLYISCYFFIKAVKPTDQYLVGNHPQILMESFKAKKEYNSTDFVNHSSMSYQEMIKENTDINYTKSKSIKVGLNIIIISIMLSSLVAVCMYVYPFFLGCLGGNG